MKATSKLIHEIHSPVAAEEESKQVVEKVYGSTQSYRREAGELQGAEEEEDDDGYTRDTQYIVDGAVIGWCCLR